jgi:hypothetical protein
MILSPIFLTASRYYFVTDIRVMGKIAEGDGWIVTLCKD